MGLRSIKEETKWEIMGQVQLGTLSNRQIAKNFAVSEKCVRIVRKNYSKTLEVKDSERSGRPKKLSERDVSMLVRELRRDPFLSFQDLANQFSSGQGRVRVSKDTVRRAVGKRGMYSYVAPRKPLLSIKQKLNRIRWFIYSSCFF